MFKSLNRVFLSLFFTGIITTGFSVSDTLTIPEKHNQAKVDTNTENKSDSTIVPKDNTTKLKTNLVKEVGEKTQSLSDLFSFSNIVVSIIILFITYVFLQIISGLLTIWAERKAKYRITLKGFIPLIRILTWVASISFIIVAVFQPSKASILPVSASIGVAVGFAAQDLLKNIFGGIILIIDKPFQIGDKVQIGQHYGEVTEINLRSTRITTPDDSLVSVPNAEVMNQAISNANSGEENCQVVTELFLPLHADVQFVKQSAMEAAQVSKYIYLNKPITILLLHESIGHKVMLKLKVKAYVNDIRNEFAFKSEITEVLTKEFGKYYQPENFNNSDLS